MATSKRLNHRTLHWFRKGLRLHDNPALLHACETSVEIWPVYVLNPDIITYGGNIGFNRWRFLMESLQDLDVQLRKLKSRCVIGSIYTSILLRNLLWQRVHFQSNLCGINLPQFYHDYHTKT